MTGNSIDFQVDNRQTNFDLVGDKTWADWGDFRGDAVNVLYTPVKTFLKPSGLPDSNL